VPGSYIGVSDAEAIELSVVDLRWQMVLGCLGAVTPPFSQGALQAFRERMVAHEMDRHLDYLSSGTGRGLRAGRDGRIRP
jgi:hypothetical protein